MRGGGWIGSLRALPKRLWMTDALHQRFIHLRRPARTAPYRREITIFPSRASVFTGSA